jgi:hypothetical protein
MAKRGVDYGNLALTGDKRPEPETAQSQSRPKAGDAAVLTTRRNSFGRPKRDGLGEEGRTAKERAHQWMVPLHPEAVRTLKKLAVERDCKPTDLSIEAFEQYFCSLGLNTPVRIRSIFYQQEE